MAEPVIIAEHLSKTYLLNGAGENTLKAVLDRLLFRGRHEPDPIRGELREITALNDVSFEVKKGEVLGIIGRNGAGKSTLLKILSEITKPSAGSLRISGCVASILDLGMGFQPELSGRDNVFLRGELLGMNRKEIREKFEQIVCFSEIEKFIDIPVKHYSDGMFLRLAFSIVVHLRADILIFDDVLSVGDASFQLKCTRKIESLIGEGKTIIYVTHDLGEVVKICNRVIFLEKGKMLEFGPAQKTVNEYLEKVIIEGQGAEGRSNGWSAEIPTRPDQTFLNQVTWDVLAESPGNELVRIKKTGIRTASGIAGQPLFSTDPLLVEIEFVKFTDDAVFDVGFVLNHFKKVVFIANPLFDENTKISACLNGHYRCTALVPGNLLNNSVYSIDVCVLKNKNEVLLYLSDILFFRINEQKNEFIRLVQNFTDELPGCIRPKLNWTVVKL